MELLYYWSVIIHEISVLSGTQYINGFYKDVHVVKLVYKGQLWGITKVASQLTVGLCSECLFQY